MKMHAVETEIHLSDECKATAEFLSKLIAFWYGAFPQAEQRVAIPRTRAEWRDRVGRLAERADLGARMETVQGLNEALAKVADFEIRQIDDAEIVIEYSAPLILTMTATPRAEGDRPIIH